MSPQRQYKAFQRDSVKTSAHVRHGRNLDCGKSEKMSRPIGATPRSMKDWR